MLGELRKLVFDLTREIFKSDVMTWTIKHSWNPPFLGDVIEKAEGKSADGQLGDVGTLPELRRPADFFHGLFFNSAKLCPMVAIIQCFDHKRFCTDQNFTFFLTIYQNMWL